MKKFLFISALLFGFGLSMNAQDFETDLVFYLTCNGENFTDVISEASGMMSGLVYPDEGIESQTDGAWYFDGESSIDFNDADVIGLPVGGDARTYALWLNTTMASGSCDMISYGTEGQGNHVHFAYRVGEGKIRNGYWFADYDFNVEINDGIWHHIAVSVSVEDGTCNFYLDGLPFGSEDLKTDPELNTILNGLLRVGARNNPAAMYEPFEGFLDEVRIYNRALGDEDIAALYAFVPEEGEVSVSEYDVTKFKVYPTMAEYELNISSDFDIHSVEIFDMAGKIVLETQMKNVIDVSSLSSGVYFINGIGTQKTYTAKFIKK